MSRNFVRLAKMLISVLLLVCGNAALADTFFNKNELQNIHQMSYTTACLDGCTFVEEGAGGGLSIEYKLTRLEIRTPDGISAYLVSKKEGVAGSAGFPAAVLLRNEVEMLLVQDQFGLSVDRAERIARNELEGRGLVVDRGVKNDAADLSDQRVVGSAVTPLNQSNEDSENRRNPFGMLAIIVCVAMLCLISGFVAKKTSDDLTIKQRIALQCGVSVISGVVLYLIGAETEVKLLILPVLLGVSLSLALTFG